MSLITRMRRQTCVYWEIIPGFDKFGKQQVAAPVELACRWEDVLSEYTNEQGTRQVAACKVFVPLQIPLGSYIWKGTLADLQAAASVDSTILVNDPATVPSVTTVVGTEVLPNLKATENLNIAYSNK
jgi:hypothetical protein